MLAYLKWKCLLPVPGIYETGGISSSFTLYLSTSWSSDAPHSLVCCDHLLTTWTNSSLCLLFLVPIKPKPPQVYNFWRKWAEINLKFTWLCFRAPLSVMLSPYAISSSHMRFLYPLPDLEWGLHCISLLINNLFSNSSTPSPCAYFFVVVCFLFVWRFWHCYSEA